MIQPRISIIIPTLNQGQYIETAIVSVLNQHYENLQLIVIDGGSTDNTQEIISRYSIRIQHYVSEKDSGQTEAINKGLKLATGEIITWLNSDDLYQPGVFNLIVPYFKDSTVGIVYGKAKTFGEKRKTRIVGNASDMPEHMYLPYMRIPQPAMFLSRLAISAAGPLNQSLHFAMDFELTAKVVLAGFKIKRIENLIANYRFHETSKSNLNHKFLEEWTREVHAILCSADAARFAGREMESLFNLPSKSGTNYTWRISLDHQQAEDIFLEHLNFHFHEAYRDRNEKEMRRIAGYIKQKFPNYYTRKKYSVYLRRIRIFPGFLLNLTRKITR